MEMKEILEKLSHRGLKLTPQRIEMIRVLAQGKQHKTAEEVHREMQVNQPQIALGTVYRNLGLMVEKDLVSQLDIRESSSLYELNLKGHHHHLICLKCCKAIDVQDCPVCQYSKETGAENDFKVLKHRLEIYGYCKRCK